MAYVIGVVHPKGEKDTYDGFFLKESEFETVAKQLIGKPLLYNHDHESPLGHVISAWTGPGKNNDNELFILGEIDSRSLDGHLAKYAISEGILQDFSLGHSLKVLHSANSRKVVDKTPIEVSVCAQGARENTCIYAIAFHEPYINSTKSKEEKKTTKTKQKDKMATPQSNEKEEQPVKLTHSVMQQLKTQQARIEELEGDLKTYYESGRRQREHVFKNGVQDFVNQLLDANPEIAIHKPEIDVFLKKAVNSESGTPLVKMLQAAAVKSSNSVVELEKAYQEQKRQDERINALQKELETFKIDAFALPEQRMVVASSSSEQPPAAKRQKKMTTPLSKDLFTEIEEAIRSTRGTSAIPNLDTNLYEKSRFGNQTSE